MVLLFSLLGAGFGLLVLVSMSLFFKSALLVFSLIWIQFKIVLLFLFSFSCFFIYNFVTVINFCDHVRVSPYHSSFSC
jgi:hypothetical protein